MDPLRVETSKARWRLIWRVSGLLAAIGVVALLAWEFDVFHRIEGLRAWLGSLGWWGPLLFGLIYAGLTTFGLPTAILTALAGGLFGSIVGVVTVSAGWTMGCSSAFLIGRYLARGPMEKWLSGSRRFTGLDRLTGEHGAMMVALSRLVPILPCPVVNYGFGLTRVRLGTFVFYSWLCRLPGQVVMVVGFDAVLTGIRQGRVPWFLLVIVAVVVTFLVVVICRGRRRLLAVRAEIGRSKA